MTESFELTIDGVPRTFSIGIRVSIWPANNEREKCRIKPFLRNMNEGCIVYIFSRAFRGTHVGIALDFPMNTSPTVKEKDFAIKYDIPGGELHALVLNLQDIESDIRIIPIMSNVLVCESSSFILCNLKSCRKVMRRGNMLITCNQLNHCVCAGHIVPWKYDSEIPNLEIIQPFFRKLQQYVSKSQQTDIHFLKTRTLLSFSSLHNLQEVSENDVTDALKIQARNCPCCLEQKKNNVGLTIEQWNQQLFSTIPIKNPKNEVSYKKSSNYNIETNINSYVNNNNNDEQSLDSICQDLLLKGYSYDQISTAIENIPIQERMQIDSDFLEVLIISTSPHFATQSKKQLKKNNVCKISSPSSSNDNIAYNPNDHNNKNNKNYNENDSNIMTNTSTSSYFNQHNDNNNTTSTNTLLTLPTLILVTVIWPKKSKVENVWLESGITYDGIISTLCERLNVSLSSDDSEAIYVVDSCGWHEELTSQIPVVSSSYSSNSLAAMSTVPPPPPSTSSTTTSPSYRDHTTITTDTLSPLSSSNIFTDGYGYSMLYLKNKDILSIRSVRDSVGPPFKLSVLHARFKHSRSVQKKIQRLGKSYEGWRSIRGDGNCYYRAIIFGVLEQLIYQQSTAKLARLYEIFATLKPYVNALQLASLNRVLYQLNSCLEGRGWQNIPEFESSILDSSTHMDISLICVCRLLVSCYLRQNEDLELNGLAIRDAILPSYEDVNDIKSYCKKYVEPIGVDAEGVLVSAGILLSALQCIGCTIYLDSRDNVDITVVGSVYNHGHNQPPTSFSHQSEKDSSEDRTPSTGRVTSNTSTNTRDESRETQNYDSSSCQWNDNGLLLDAIGAVHLLLRPGHYDLLYLRDDITPPGSSFETIIEEISSLLSSHSLTAEQEVHETLTDRLEDKDCHTEKESTNESIQYHSHSSSGNNNYKSHQHGGGKVHKNDLELTVTDCEISLGELKQHKQQRQRQRCESGDSGTSIDMKSAELTEDTSPSFRSNSTASTRTSAGVAAAAARTSNCFWPLSLCFQSTPITTTSPSPQTPKH